MNVDTDVIIIGAGAAGLAAAIELQATSLRYIVLEARSRVGGRAWTDRDTFVAAPVDLGASWIHSFGPNNPIYQYYRRLGRERKVECDNQCYRGLLVDYDGKEISTSAQRKAHVIMERLYQRLEKFAEVKNGNDDQSIAQVIQTTYDGIRVNHDEQVRRIVDLILSGIEQYEASDLENLSAKYWDTGDASGDDRWVSCGYGTLLERICDKHQIPVRLNALVTRINTNDPDCIAVTVSSGHISVIHAHYVLITVPLGCLKRDTIVFEPPLPDWKRQAINQMGFGLMNKLVMQFPRCFWGRNINSITHTCQEQRGRFRLTLCLPSPANILILFVTGSFASDLELLTDEEILVKIMKFLRNIFRDRLVPDPVKYKFTRWSHDPFARGSYSNFAVHSTPNTIEQLARETADGRVHWAGEHTSFDDGSGNWTYACVHSAFQSGQRAAKAIQMRLSESHSL